MFVDLRGEVAGQLDVVLDPPRVGLPAVRQQRDPDLERVEPAAELRPPEAEVDAAVEIVLLVHI